MKKGFLHDVKSLHLEDGAEGSRNPPATDTISRSQKPADGPSEQRKEDKQTFMALEDCIQLLKGPTDERRVVGLLLVTKLLPAGDPATIRAVYDAVGTRFISRLLLPLRQNQVGDDSCQKDASACVLALALLATSCRLPDIAATEEVVEKVPLFVKVVQNSGVSQVLHMAPGLPEGQDWERTDKEAVKDALECLLAVAAASPEGRTICIESGAVAAACSALQPQDGGGKGVAAREALALHLLGVLLDLPDRSGILEDNAGMIRSAVPRVAAFMVLDTRASSSATADDKAKRPEGEPAPAPPAPDVLDPAALQLQALHVLLLILASPPPELEKNLTRPYSDEPRPRPDEWELAARAGLGTLLRGRLPPAQRQAALQLTAAILRLAGTPWLLGPSDYEGGLPEAFFQVLAEVVKVEALITLRDALSPKARIPLPHTHRPLIPPQPAGANTGTVKELSMSAPGDTEEDSDDDATQEFAPMMPPLERPAPLVDEEGNDLQPFPTEISSHMQGDSMAASSMHGETELAGDRAARVLPSVFALAEGCVSALATDSANSEDGLPQVLSDRVATRAMSSLQEAYEGVLQYLEAAARGEVNAKDPIILAAIRSLARFLAEAPDAFAERVQKLLPFILTVHQGRGIPFMLPLLSQVAPEATRVEEGTIMDAAWLAALLHPQAMGALAMHVAGIASEARMLAAACEQRASHDLAYNADTALEAAQQELSPALDVLLAIQANAAQSWVSAEQREVALEKLLEALPALISWPRERVRTAAPTLHEDLSTSKDLDRIQLRSLLNMAWLVASTLLMAVQQGRPSTSALCSAAASLVSHAVDKGFLCLASCLAMARSSAVWRAQHEVSKAAKLAGSQQALGVTAAVAEDDWPSHIESIKDVWPPFVSSATHLAAESTEFAAEMKRVKSLWSEEGADKAGADVSSQLQDLRTAVFGQL